MATGTGSQLSQQRVNPFVGLTRKHGIKCESIDGVAIEAYVKAAASLVKPENIIAASRANGSVIVFLDSLPSVEEVCMYGLTVGDSFVNVQPLVKPATKVVLSGVPPFIPNCVLENELSQYGRIVSTMRIIPLGCKQPNLRHVKSFRRQVFMLCDDNLEGVINVVHEERYYRVYLSTDEIVCYKCHKKGHIQRNCRENLEKLVPNDQQRLSDKPDKNTTDDNNIAAMDTVPPPANKNNDANDNTSSNDKNETTVNSKTDKNITGQTDKHINVTNKNEKLKNADQNTTDNDIVDMDTTPPSPTNSNDGNDIISSNDENENTVKSATDKNTIGTINNENLKNKKSAEPAVETVDNNVIAKTNDKNVKTTATESAKIHDDTDANSSNNVVSENVDIDAINTTNTDTSLNEHAAVGACAISESELSDTRTGLCNANKLNKVNENTSNIVIDEERVRTPHSQPAPSGDFTFSLPPPQDFVCISVSENLPGSGGDDDNESITSDMSDLSAVSCMEDTSSETKEKKLSSVALARFVKDSFNSRKLIDQATAFCPDLGLLARSLNKYRKNPSFSTTEKIRLRRMTSRIWNHVKQAEDTSARDVINEPSCLKEEIMYKRRGISPQSDLDSID